MSLFTNQVHIISQETETQKVECPLLFFQENLSVDVLVVQHVDVVLVSDNDDVSPVSNLSKFYESAKEDEPADAQAYQDCQCEKR